MPKKLTQKEVEERYEALGFIFLDKYINSKIYYKTLCKCGKIFKSQPNAIFTNQAKSCGHCNDPEVGDKIHNITITGIKIIGQYGCRVQGQCDCGNVTKWMPVCLLRNGDQKTCGRCYLPEVGDKFGSLTIIQVRPCRNGGGCSVKCKCDCNKITKWMHYERLKTGHCVSCGNCALKRNGKFTSNISLQLHDLIEQILNKKCEHNYYISGIGCIDIVQTELKIAIEYDGYYNHKIRNGDRTKKDQAKYYKIVDSGWQFLNIKSDGTDLPSKDQLEKVLLNHFQHGVKRHTITMYSWRKAQKKYG